jgi:hypothetical protein
MKQLVLVCFTLAILLAPESVYGQFTDPRSYDNTPVGTNQVELAYAYAHSNASIDPSLIVSNARFNLNQGSLGFTRYFGITHHLAWVQASVPIASLSAAIVGTQIQESTTGFGDSSYQFAALLKGGPTLSVAQFENYRPRNVLGVSLSVTAPTGSYDADKLLNLGSDRWSFKPEVAIAHPFGPELKWQVEGYANCYFFNDNTSYHGAEILRQQPLPGVEGHLSYSLNDKVWASFDTRYSFRGTTEVGGVEQDNSQRNFILGSEVNVSLNSRNSLVFEFATALVHHNGPTTSGFAVKYNYTWGAGY